MMTLVIRRPPLSAGLLVLALSLPACSAQGPAETQTADPRIAPEYNKDGRLTRLTYDKNGDGKPDTWGYMDGTRVVRVEVDEDGDGQVDRWEYHRNPDGGTPAQTPVQDGAPDKTIERIERATRHDGKVSRKEFFENGLLIRVEEDTDGDGKIDKWETYTAGTLASMAFDSQHRGTPDRRLVYNADGSLDRIEADASGSGTFERVGP